MELIERSFTTEPRGYVKRGCGTVRKRCVRFIAILKQRGILNEIPLATAKKLFQEEMGIWDRVSLKKYFGTQEDSSKRSILRTATYPRTGTISHKLITLDQPARKTKGYLERLGLVSFEKRGRVWFLILRETETVIPVLVRNSRRESEESESSKGKIYLSSTHFPDAQAFHESPIETTDTIENREERECNRVIYKFDNSVIKRRTGVFKTYPKKELSPEELRILRVATKEGS